jgi:alkylhydroperoxidase family enzyme
MSVRRAVAQPETVEDLMDELIAYEQSDHLAEYQKVALRFHDTFLTNPAGLTDDVREQVLEHFSAEQIVELVFKFIWWSTNRPVATIGPDAPHDPERIRSFHYTERGEYVVHPVGETTAG